MPLTPDAIHRAAASFDGLPGVGPRAALRFAYWLVSQPRDVIMRFADALTQLAQDVTRCAECGLWSDRSPCSICADPTRNPSIICVVAHPQDVRVIDGSGAFKGRYHVLGGTLDPVSGRLPETLWIAPLIQNVSRADSPVHEVILAFDADVPGDTTCLYLKKQLLAARNNTPLRISRLARGLPNGAALEYADEMTIADALEHRRES
jgi:recombination protein RecR